MIKQSFKNINYVSCPQNSGFGDLFKKLPINRLTDNIVERLKVSLIKKIFDNRIYESNPQNIDFENLPFDVDKRLITRLLLYCIDYDIIFKLKNVLITYI